MIRKHMMSLTFLVNIYFNAYVVGMDGNPFGATFIGVCGGEQLERWGFFNKRFYSYPYPDYHAVQVQRKPWKYVDVELFTNVFLAARYVNLKILQEDGIPLSTMISYETYIQAMLQRSRIIISEYNTKFCASHHHNLLPVVDNSFYRKHFVNLPLWKDVNSLDQLPKK